MKDDNRLVVDWQLIAQFPKNKHKQRTLFQISAEDEEATLFTKQIKTVLRPKCHPTKMIIR